MTNNTMPTLTLTTWGETFELTPAFGKYANNRLVVSFDCSGGPYGTITVNLPYMGLAKDEVLIKDWSENAPLANALLTAGWIKYTGVEVPTGFVSAKVATLAGPLLQAFLDSGLKVG